MVFKLLNTLFSTSNNMIGRKGGKSFSNLGKICTLSSLYSTICVQATFMFSKIGRQAKEKKVNGEDAFGNTYSTIEEMWSRELAGGAPDESGEYVLNKVGSEQNWYKKQVDYWNVSVRGEGIFVYNTG
jgi:hypothetical protein